MGLKNQSVAIFCKTTSPSPKLLWGEQQKISIIKILMLKLKKDTIQIVWKHEQKEYDWNTYGFVNVNQSLVPVNFHSNGRNQHVFYWAVCHSY